MTKEQLFEQILVDDPNSFTQQNMDNPLPYVQYTRGKSVDWIKAIALLRELIEAKSPDAHMVAETLSTLSSSWVTCACGSRCSIVPRHDSGVPKDDFLVDLGLEFTDYFYTNSSVKDMDDALETLKNIEVCSGQIIRQIEGGKNEN